MRLMDHSIGFCAKQWKQLLYVHGPLSLFFCQLIVCSLGLLCAFLYRTRNNLKAVVRRQLILGIAYTDNVPVNSKTAHPSPGNPRHLTHVKLLTVGNLTQNEARPVGHLTFVSKSLSAVGSKTDFAILWFSTWAAFSGHCSTPRGLFCCCCRFI